MWKWLISYFTDVLFFQMFVLWKKKMVWITCIIGKAITVATTYQHGISESRVTCIGNNIASSHISDVYYSRLFPTIDISRPIIIWLGLNILICHSLCQLFCLAVSVIGLTYFTPPRHYQLQFIYYWPDYVKQ